MSGFGPTPDHGVEPALGADHHRRMDTPKPLPPAPQPNSLEAAELSLLRLKREMEELNARLQYLGLMLRLGARK